MKNIHIIIIILFSLLLPAKIFAQTTNLSIASYSFQKSPPLQYQENRLYIVVHNNSQEDFLGEVAISYIRNSETVQLGSPLEVSIVGYGEDTVWFDGSFSFYTEELVFTVSVVGDVGNPFESEFTVEIKGDNDADGIPDEDDPDDDNDGLLDDQEIGKGTYATDPDTDDDGVLDGADVFPLNPDESADNDGDGLGDNEDLDDDNDGIPDIEEKEKGTDPFNPDTDEDGLKDGEDLNPIDEDDAGEDLDGDGISNYDEKIIYGTDVNNKDTDGDGIEDGVEVKYGLDPNNNADAQQDLDGDGLSNLLEIEKGLDIEDRNTHVVADAFYVKLKWYVISIAIITLLYVKIKLSKDKKTT